jgi:thiosulfate dehydrogenase (quinone)
MSKTVVPEFAKPPRDLIMMLAMLSFRIIQGFIYWGGGSRRFTLEAQPGRPHLDGATLLR